MKYIASSDNAKIKLIRSLGNKKARSENNMFLLEGERLVFSAPDGFLKEIYIGESAERAFGRAAGERFGDYTLISDRVFEKISDTVNAQGILALADIPAARRPDGKIICVADGVADPGNLGSVLRSAVAFGIYDIVAVNCVDAYSPKAVRATMGGIYHANVVRTSYAGARDIIVNGGYETIVLDMSGENIYSYTPRGKIAVVTGNEAHGVSAEFKRLADKTLSIPMPGRAESLNAAVSASIAISWLSHNL